VWGVRILILMGGWGRGLAECNVPHGMAKRAPLGIGQIWSCGQTALCVQPGAGVPCTFTTSSSSSSRQQEEEEEDITTPTFHAHKQNLQAAWQPSSERLRQLWLPFRKQEDVVYHVLVTNMHANLGTDVHCALHCALHCPAAAAVPLQAPTPCN
jgi:hypothetical protein